MLPERSEWLLGVPWCVLALAARACPNAARALEMAARAHQARHSARNFRSGICLCHIGSKIVAILGINRWKVANLDQYVVLLGNTPPPPPGCYDLFFSNISKCLSVAPQSWTLVIS